MSCHQQFAVVENEKAKRKFMKRTVSNNLFMQIFPLFSGNLPAEKIVVLKQNFSYLVIVSENPFTNWFDRNSNGFFPVELSFPVRFGFSVFTWNFYVFLFSYFSPESINFCCKCA
jgi:hypothetical protein